MKRILQIVLVAVFGFGFNVNVFAESLKVLNLLKVPDLFNNGPAAPLTAISLQAEEISSLMLLESIVDLSSAAVSATGCRSLEGKYPIEISTDGIVNKPESNIAKITSIESSEPLVLNATIEAPDAHFGQQINIRQAKDSKLKETQISSYISGASLNHELTLLSWQSNSNILGQNNTLVAHQDLLLKHFYEEQKADKSGQYISGWGTASLSKANYPTNLLWAQSKALKTGDQLKRVVLQEDLLIGTTSCRILADTNTETKTDKQKVDPKKVLLKGVLTISTPQNLKNDAVGFEF